MINLQEYGKNVQKTVVPAEWSQPLFELLQNGSAAARPSLGWLNPEEWAGAGQIEAIQALAERLRPLCDCFIVLGIGGSNNGARGIVKALEHDRQGPEIVWGACSLSARELARVVRLVRERDCCVEVIAKNFATLEPGSWFRVLRQEMEAKYGKAEAARRIVCCGTRGQSLHRLADEQGYSFIDFPENIGGRFSTLCPVGLLPVAVAGGDIAALAAGAAAERADLLAAGAQNAAAAYAWRRNQLNQAGCTLELLAHFEPVLAWFGKWWIQLFAESEGKEKKGLFPAQASFSEDLHSVGQFIQEGTPTLFESFLHIVAEGPDVTVRPDDKADGFDYLDGFGFNRMNRAVEAATLTAHHSAAVPCLQLDIPALDERSLGALFYFFQAACMLSAAILGVNAFDQPGVEAYKQEMFKLLKA